MPAGHTYLVKSFSLANTGAGTATVEILTNGTGLGNRLDRFTVSAGVGVHRDDVWWVFEPGDDLRITASAAATVTVFGTDLLGVA